MDGLIKTLRDNDRKKALLKAAKCFILDLDGTFYLEDHILDGSLDFLRQCEKMNIGFRFYTNNSSKNEEFYIKRITKMGYPVKPGMMMTSNQVIIRHLKDEMAGKTVFLLGTDYLKRDFCDAGIRLTEGKPDIVVVGFDTTLEYERLSKACKYIREGALFYAVNPDFNCPVKDGFIPDCGSICALITASTGKTPRYFGKPYADTLNYILKATGLKAEEIVFVGDRLYTDIAIGEGNDATTILVLTGETAEEDVLTSQVKPKLIFDSLKAVKEFLETMES